MLERRASGVVVKINSEHMELHAIKRSCKVTDAQWNKAYSLGRKDFRGNIVIEQHTINVCVREEAALSIQGAFGDSYGRIGDLPVIFSILALHRYQWSMRERTEWRSPDYIQPSIFFLAKNHRLRETKMFP
jgi:hypothetical protein